MQKTASFKTFLLALLIGLGGALAGAFSPVLLVPAAAATVFLGVRYGRSYAAVPFAFTLLAIFLAHIGDNIIMYALWCSYAFFCVFCYKAFVMRAPYRITALVLAAAALIALYLGIGLPSLLAGKAPYDGILDGLRLIDEYYRASGYLLEDIAALRDTIPNTFYGILIMLAEAAAFGTVILAYKFSKAAKAELRPMARFREWQLPPSLKLGIIVFAAAIIIMYAAKFNGAPVVLYAVLYMLLPLLVAMGIATALYLASRGRDRIPVFVRIFVIMAAVISPYMLAIFGAIDLFAGIRRKLIRTDRLIKEAFEKAKRENSSVVTVDFGDGNGPQIIARRKDSAFFDYRIDDDEAESGNGAGSAEDPAQTGDNAPNAENGPAPNGSDATNTDENPDGGEE